MVLPRSAQRIANQIQLPSESFNGIVQVQSCPDGIHHALFLRTQRRISTFAKDVLPYMDIRIKESAETEFIDVATEPCPVNVIMMIPAEHHPVSNMAQVQTLMKEVRKSMFDQEKGRCHYRRPI